MKIGILGVLLLCALPSAIGAEPAVERLARFLTGEFSSAEQAAADRNFRPVVLHVVRIWPERSDGPWLYVEQAMAEAIDQPYRQRVYQLAPRSDGSLESRVFTLRDPIAATGAWKSSEPLAHLQPNDLTAREGCTVFLREQDDGTFRGSTEGDGCASDLRGARYATSEVHLSADLMVSWDRGYDASGKQVWGAVSGGYRFKRIR